jgi:two-component system, sensor histidine kinase LadS
LHNSTSIAQDLIFDIAYENINVAKLYTYTATDSLPMHVLTIGNKINFEHWPIKNRHCPMPYTLGAGQMITLFFYIECSREVQFTLTVRKKNNYIRNEIRQHTILGMYTGFFLMIIIMNCFFFFNFRDPVYIWYILLCLTIGISVLTFEGLHNAMLAWGFTWITINLDVFNAYAGLIASFLFVSNFLDLRKYTPFIFYTLIANCIIVSIVVIIYFISNIHVIFILEYILVSVSFLVYLVAGIIIMRKGFSHARTFVLAYSIILISIISWVISDYFIDISFGISSEREMMIGSIIEMTILTYALSVRMKQLHVENIKFRSQLFQYVKEIAELKMLVDEKSIDIEQQKNELTQKWELTSREIDVLKLIAYGCSNKEIADRLFISVNTVKYHTKNIYDKLQSSGRVETLLKITNMSVTGSISGLVS